MVTAFWKLQLPVPIEEAGASFIASPSSSLATSVIQPSRATSQRIRIDEESEQISDMNLVKRNGTNILMCCVTLVLAQPVKVVLLPHYTFQALGKKKLLSAKILLFD
ncbi:MAG: hypothetical protein HC878_02435 [Leptolyngbyaceae cyanobacterium SL_5_14]|nr:hypothetical protein [Leptolyngbyaceae cyanobacterium SL_5_14]